MISSTRIHCCVAVMAGGSGRRLWPRSTAHAPKQFHGFFGGPVLLRQTLARAALLVPPSQTYVVTTAQHLEQTRQLCGADVRMLGEPAMRDTAACAGFAALHIEREHPGAVMILLPADHWVDDHEAFMRTLTAAATLAGAHDSLVTIGAQPARAESGYGYIQVEQQAAGHFRSKRFLEKPSAEEAARLIAGGDFLWNTGVYVVKAATLLAMIRQYLPDLGAGLDVIDSALGTVEAAETIRLVYTGLSGISLDHGVTERVDHVLVVPAQFRWDDLGSWTAFARVLPRDASGNLLAGQVFANDANGCLVDTPDLNTALLGVRNLIVVQDGDGLLVCNADHAQEVKGIPHAVSSPSCGSGQHVVMKPWGRELWWAITPSYVGKVLEVRAGERLSLQYHRRKLETLRFERGEGELILGEQRLAIYPGLTVTIQPGTVHRVIARTHLRILEVSTPDLEDVVRVQDDYGRGADA